MPSKHKVKLYRAARVVPAGPIAEPLGESTIEPGSVAGSAPIEVEEKAAPLFVWLLFGCVLIAHLSFVLNHSYPVPDWDESAYIPYVVGAKPVTAGWLWSQANEHRIPLPRLLYIALARASSLDARVMNSATVLLLGVTTCFLLMRLRRLQGRTTYAHAFVPLLLLNPDHYSNTVWPIQIGLVLPTCLMCCAIVIQAQGGRAMGKFFALGPLALLTCMCGANGLPLALSISPMLLWIGVRDYRAGARRRGAALLLFAIAIYVYTIAYFIHLERLTPQARPWKLDEALSESVIAVSMSLGSCAQHFWPYATIGIIALLIACSLLLLWRMVRQPDDRLSASGLLLMLSGCVGLAVLIGFGRTILGPGAAWAPRYATFVAPILFTVFVAYARFGSIAVRSFVQMTLLISLSLGFTLNGVRAIAEIEAQVADGRVLEKEVAQHVAIARLAAEHGSRWMFTPAFFAENMRLLMNARTGIYKRYPPDLNGDVLWLLSEGTELQGPSTSGTLFRLEDYGIPAGTGLIAHPPHRASVLLDRPARYLHVGYGILHDASAAEFRVSLRALDGRMNLLWSRTLDPVTVPSDRGINEANIELPQGVKRNWRIVFETLTRPGKDDLASPPFWTAVTVR